MIGVTFTDPKDKGRLSTVPLAIKQHKIFRTSAEVIDFFYNSDFNTFFSSDIDISQLPKIQMFKQGADKEKYITQDDIKDEGASVIALDFDRHSLITGAATNTDASAGLAELSKEFGTLLYAESKSAGELFKGRIFIFLNKRHNKKVFQKYLELWLYHKYDSGYIISWHLDNAPYFLGWNSLNGCHVRHEYVDAVSFNDSHKLNIYDKSTMKIYHGGALVWTAGYADPEINICSTDINHRLQKYGKANDLILPTKWNHNGCIPVNDLLSDEEKKEVIERAKVSKKGLLRVVGKTDTEISKLSTREIFETASRLVKDGEYPLDGLLRRSDGMIKTAREFVTIYKNGESANFAYEPNHRAETGYLYMKGGKLFDYQGGNTTLINLVDIKGFERKEIDYEGQYLPKVYKDEVGLIEFAEAPTGGGKSYNSSYKPDTIFLVPKRALGHNLSSMNGFVYIGSTGDKNVSIKRMQDIPEDKKDCTIVMTYDKFAWLHAESSMTDYKLIIDEAPNLLKSEYDKYTKLREELIADIFDGLFTHVKFISADPFYYENFEYFVENGAVKWSDIEVRAFIPKKDKEIVFEATTGFTSEEYADLANQRTIVYCNDKSKGKQWAERIGGELIYAGGDIDADMIDRNPDKNYVFTSVIREGFSFTSHVDNMIIDARTNTVCGVNTVIQAASRARTKASKYRLVHSLKEKEHTQFMARFCDIKLYIELGEVFYEANGYTLDERKVIKYLELYSNINKAIDNNNDYLSILSLVGCRIEQVEKLEQRDINFMAQNLARAGYGLVMNPKAKVEKFEKGSSDSEKPTLDDIKIRNGKEAYDSFTDKHGGEFTVRQFTNFVYGLYKGKNKKRPTLLAAWDFYTKVGIKVEVIDANGNAVKMYATKKNIPPKCKVRIEDIDAFFGRSSLVPPPEPMFL
ncbi:DEAD/DEAH box helicase family protein [Sulfurovum sp. XTW-4]|uniref:DEAD/DEAH box helicase family protein n=1 Tax=Sulfurovum xiamenensis TaxID=3019066 RepID=A0ABT7QTV1_9BACT|nr:DEAD/DEAH box helicase family protein [Sulfurovum xiamenensis]MDM5264512.1 DEAD/DEAH box helicase family protein [Sulfurovum xiamenensis]